MLGKGLTFVRGVWLFLVGPIGPYEVAPGGPDRAFGLRPTRVDAAARPASGVLLRLLTLIWATVPTPRWDPQNAGHCGEGGGSSAFLSVGDRLLLSSSLGVSKWTASGT
jgi:hypothetical protein